MKPRIYWRKQLKQWGYWFELNYGSGETIDVELLKKVSEFCKKLNGGKNEQ